MIVRLRTRCGCERSIDIAGAERSEYVYVALWPDLIYEQGSVQKMGVRKRSFKYHGEYARGVPLYYEELE